MISFQLKRFDSGYFLQERDYPAQGVSPFYTRLCRLTDEEAGALHRSGLVRLEDGGPAPADGGMLPEELLSLVSDGCRLEIRLSLRPCGIRPKPFEAALPGFEKMLETAAAEESRCANLVRNTGIADRRQEAAAA